MLNDNLVKIRKERGLTQEALSVKLNIVRQTISKWENGKAVPDVDTLCKIADALDVPVTVLLGRPEVKDDLDVVSISKALTEINEQLAVRNRRSGFITKIIVVVLILILGMVAIVSASNIRERKQNAEQIYEEPVGTPGLMIDEQGVPVLEQIKTYEKMGIRDMWEHEMCVYLEAGKISKQQFVDAWGVPIQENTDSASWIIDEEWVLTISFDNSSFAYGGGFESRSLYD